MSEINLPVTVLIGPVRNRDIIPCKGVTTVNVLYTSNCTVKCYSNFNIVDYTPTYLEGTMQLMAPKLCTNGKTLQ